MQPQFKYECFLKPMFRSVFLWSGSFKFVEFPEPPLQDVDVRDVVSTSAVAGWAMLQKLRWRKNLAEFGCDQCKSQVVITDRQLQYNGFGWNKCQSSMLWMTASIFFSSAATTIQATCQSLNVNGIPSKVAKGGSRTTTYSLCLHLLGCIIQVSSHELTLSWPNEIPGFHRLFSNRPKAHNPSELTLPWCTSTRNVPTMLYKPPKPVLSATASPTRPPLPPLQPTCCYTPSSRPPTQHFSAPAPWPAHSTSQTTAPPFCWIQPRLSLRSSLPLSCRKQTKALNRLRFQKPWQ